MWNIKQIKDYFAFSVLLLVLFQLLHYYTPLQMDDLLMVASAISIFLGALIIWKDSASIFGSLEKQKKKEEAEERKLAVDFSKKYPKLNKIPLARWKYSQTMLYLLAITAIFFAGVLFRLIDVEVIGIYTDEFSHLIKAMSLGDHGTTEYFKNGALTEPFVRPRWHPAERAYFLTWTISVMFKWFGQSLLVARLPIIILSAATAIPLYFVGKKINRRVGLIAAIIWLMSPWALVIGRMVREYAIFPIFYLIIFMVFAGFAKHLLAVLEGEKKITYSAVILGLFVTLFPLIYAFYLDGASTFQQVIVVYFTVFLYSLYLFLSSRKIGPSLKTRAMLFLVFLSLIGITILSQRVVWRNVDISPTFNSVWIDSILSQSPRQWFFRPGLYSFYLIFALGTLGSLATVIKRKFPLFFFYALTFFTFLYIYSFHFGRYNRPRYGFVMHVWLIPILAFGVYILYLILRDQSTRIRKALALILLTVLLLFTFNPVRTYAGVYTKQKGFNRIGEEFLYQFKDVHEKYGEELRDSTILCSTCGPLYWFGTVDLMDNGVYSFLIHKDKILERAVGVLEETEHGWAILDSWRFRDTQLQQKELRFRDFRLEFVDKVRGFYIYRW